MNKLLILTLALGGWVSTGCHGAGVSGIPTGTSTDGLGTDQVELIVDFKDDATEEQIRETELEAGIFGSVKPFSDMYSVDKLTTGFFPRAQAEELIQRLSKDSDVEVVEVSQTYSVPENELAEEALATNNESLDKSPNDPFWEKQWAFPMIGLEKAWNFSHGENVVVAILDTGVSDGSNASYPRIGDLKETCFKPGYNFINKNTDPYDKQSHGSHVASTVAESTHNGVGGVGIAYKACIMPVKVLSDSGSGSTAGIAEGIKWATDHGAQVINMSLGGGGYDQEMANALLYAKKKGVFVACAAGNNSRDTIEYPGAMEGCHAVSALAPSGDQSGPPGSDPTKAPLAYYSSHGKGGKDGKARLFIAAPGGAGNREKPEWSVFQSTVNPNNPKQWAMLAYSGSSMSSPMLAGVAALAISYSIKENGGYKLSDIESAIASSAVDRKDEYKFGNGVLSASNTLETISKGNSHSIVWILSGSLAAILAVGFFKKKNKI